ncbi:MAG TPA: hypothetical protein VD962_01640 [Rubricoccaceae bacterium]|nr:hypothetical protein [Rubricoccaceae bacterium]
MPQYELEGVGPAGFAGLARGRTPEEAVRQAGGFPAEATIEVQPAPDPQGWHEVRASGRPAGRLRLHQRMRFRRD